MSTNYYGVNAYGIMLSRHEAFEFCKNYLLTNFPNDYSYDEFDRNSTNDDFWDVISGVDLITVFSDVSGSRRKINALGVDYCNCCFDGEDIFMLEIDKYPSLFCAPYSSYDDLILELNKTYGKYLPQNFNFKENLVHIVGAEWG